ncbi:6-phosphogluconolactonase [Ruania albidiflava]|uniref:6-phosphogluconolactonase n=1 Tax=Ruania albidiflava TaxID=366586 RepID=UPI00146A02AD|nr:6-phosphogluconolactonase [Ruania albidiflava]
MIKSEQGTLSGGVVIADTAERAGAQAGALAADLLHRALTEKGRARVIFASAPSQEVMLRTLGADQRIDWSAVESLHMDEYFGLHPDHPAAFGQWLAERLPAAALPGLQRIQTEGDAQGEIRRYSDLVARADIDVVCLGMGVNGHVAFNEPHEASFDDPALLREVPLTTTSRQQQVDEGLFSTIGEVPERALTLTVPALLRGKSMVATVLGTIKADAVRAALMEPVSSAVPATVLRTHPDATLFLDTAAAAQLERADR